ncbi:MAG: VCBS repeat-containing protein [Richelia sp. SM1_7_0]|nr:VCBS repeat-containing protein [Richelia sp. SM1_7_0]
MQADAAIASLIPVTTTNPNPWIVKNSGTLFPDFNNDGKTDVLWRNSSTGENAVWLMNGAGISGGAFLPNLGSAWTRSTGDFNGDSKTDVLLRNSSTGENAAWLMDGSSISSGAFLPSFAGSNWGFAG